MAALNEQQAGVDATWEYIGEFCRSPQALSDPPRYRIYRDAANTEAAIRRIWPDPEPDVTVVGKRVGDQGGELEFGSWPEDQSAEGEAVSWSAKDIHTAQRAINLLFERPAAPISTGAARVCHDV